MKAHIITALSVLILALGVQAGHHEEGEPSETTVIGTTYSEDGTAHSLFAGNTDNQQIWVDYIQAHNDRDLDKIAAINADDWTGYVPDGSVIEGNATHIEWLDEWFKSADNPQWTVKWMIANSGSDDGGELQTWLTTGNDITFNDADGNPVTEHHVHDVQFVGNQIKLINVYSRPAPKK